MWSWVIPQPEVCVFPSASPRALFSCPSVLTGLAAPSWTEGPRVSTLVRTDLGDTLPRSPCGVMTAAGGSRVLLVWSPRTDGFASFFSYWISAAVPLCSERVSDGISALLNVSGRGSWAPLSRRMCCESCHRSTECLWVRLLWQVAQVQFLVSFCLDAAFCRTGGLPLPSAPLPRARTAVSSSLQVASLGRVRSGRSGVRAASQLLPRLGPPTPLLRRDLRLVAVFGPKSVLCDRSLGTPGFLGLQSRTRGLSVSSRLKWDSLESFKVPSVPVRLLMVTSVHLPLQWFWNVADLLWTLCSLFSGCCVVLLSHFSRLPLYDGFPSRSVCFHAVLFAFVHFVRVFACYRETYTKHLRATAVHFTLITTLMYIKAFLNPHFLLDVTIYIFLQFISIETIV